MLIWPFFHFALAKYMDINPWKLTGFAMYTTPHYLRMNMSGVINGESVTISHGHFSKSINLKIKKFKRMRTGLGKLYSPDSLAKLIFQEIRGLDSLQINFTVSQLDRAGNIKARETQYEYDKGMW